MAKNKSETAAVDETATADEPTTEEEAPSVEPSIAKRADDPQIAETAGLTDNQVIARRSADIHTKSAKNGEHVKVFVLPPGPKPTEENGYSHEANKAATRQYAISQGMRPVGEVRLVSIAQHENGISWNLTYAVKVAVEGEITEASEAEIVLAGKDEATANTTGNGHTSDTSDKPTA